MGRKEDHPPTLSPQAIDHLAPLELNLRQATLMLGPQPQPRQLGRQSPRIGNGGPGLLERQAGLRHLSAEIAAISGADKPDQPAQ
jgi:hypothetical protein